MRRFHDSEGLNKGKAIGQGRYEIDGELSYNVSCTAGGPDATGEFRVQYNFFCGACMGSHKTRHDSESGGFGSPINGCSKPRRGGVDDDIDHVIIDEDGAHIEFVAKVEGDEQAIVDDD